MKAGEAARLSGTTTSGLYGDSNTSGRVNGVGVAALRQRMYELSSAEEGPGGDADEGRGVEEVLMMPEYNLWKHSRPTSLEAAIEEFDRGVSDIMRDQAPTTVIFHVFANDHRFFFVWQHFISIT